MVSMALYGAALTAASGGAMVATERALGWSRQLRLTPLNPAVYILMKAMIALLLGAVAISVVNLVGLVQGKPSMPAHVWVECAVLTLLCTMVFAALGVFVGYLVPGRERDAGARPRPRAVRRSWATCSSRSTEGTHAVARRRAGRPMFGVAEVSRAPLTGDLPWYAVVNAVAWLGDLRRRRRVADEQGHGPGLSGT